MKTTFKKIILLVVISTLFASCGKDGAPGTNGTNGATGATGPTGNANVSSLTFLNFALTTSGSYYVATLPDSAITQSILDKGVVNLYWRTPSTQVWYAMPSSAGFFSTSLYDVNVWMNAPGGLDFKIEVIAGN